MVAAVLSVFLPALPHAQSPDGIRGVLQGSAGTNLKVWGHNEAVSAGLAFGDRYELLVSAERMHWPTQRETNSATRGGTTTFASAEARFLYGGPEFSPYWLVGYGRGISSPNVNETFPDPVRNAAWLLFAGGGVRKPFGDALSAFVDLRVMLEGEVDSALLMLPVRVGLSWRF